MVGMVLPNDEAVCELFKKTTHLSNQVLQNKICSSFTSMMVVRDESLLTSIEYCETIL